MFKWKKVKDDARKPDLGRAEPELFQTRNLAVMV